MNFWYQLLLSCFFFNASRNHDPSALSFWFTTNLHCLLGVCIVVAFRYREGGLLPIDRDCQVEPWNHKSSSSNCKIRRVMQTHLYHTGLPSRYQLIGTHIYQDLDKLINQTELPEKETSKAQFFFTWKKWEVYVGPVFEIFGRSYYDSSGSHTDMSYSSSTFKG